MKTIDRSIKNKSAFREVDKEQRQAKFLRQVFGLVFQEGLETSYSHKIPVDISCIYTVSRLIYLMRQLRSISNVLTQSFSSFYTCLSLRSIKTRLLGKHDVTFTANVTNAAESSSALCRAVAFQSSWFLHRFASHACVCVCLLQLSESIDSSLSVDFRYLSMYLPFTTQEIIFIMIIIFPYL